MKTVKLMLSLACILFLSNTEISAQHEFSKGTIQISKKKSIEAYILIDYRFPQRFQSSLTYITPETYAKFQEKGKMKSKKKLNFKLKDFQGVRLDNGTRYKVVKYADLTKKNIGLLPKRMLLEQVIKGEVQLFKMYSRTTGKITHELAKVVMDSKTQGDDILIDHIQNNFQLLIQKDSKNPKNVVHVNLLNFIGDNEEVRQNYENNFYGLRNQFTEKRGVLVNKKYEASFIKMLEDYNSKKTASAGN